jgi:hypothetical protein
MRPKHSISTKIIRDIMWGFDRYNQKPTKQRLRKNYKHLKYLWKYHAKKEGKYFQFRQKSYVDTEDIIYISDRWQCSYRIQELMAWAGVWKWMTIVFCDERYFYYKRSR